MTWKKDYLHPSPLQKDIRIKCAIQISDAILDALMEQDPMSRVACETCNNNRYGSGYG